MASRKKGRSFLSPTIAKEHLVEVRVASRSQAPQMSSAIGVS
jgi:hypothetical protein